jgi:hypothetical protein
MYVMLAHHDGELVACADGRDEADRIRPITVVIHREDLSKVLSGGRDGCVHGRPASQARMAEPVVSANKEDRELPRLHRRDALGIGDAARSARIARRGVQRERAAEDGVAAHVHLQEATASGSRGDGDLHTLRVAAAHLCRCSRGQYLDGAVALWIEEAHNTVVKAGGVTERVTQLDVEDHRH